MAHVNQASAPRSAGFDNLIRRIIEHPDFKQAMLASPSSSTCFGVVGMAASGSTSAQRNANHVKTGESTISRKPLQELQQIFHRRNANTSPQFQSRTNWQPMLRGRSRQTSTSGSSKRNLSTQQGGKGKQTKNRFSREVVLLRRSSDGILRVAAKAELQRLDCKRCLGQIRSCLPNVGSITSGDH